MPGASRCSPQDHRRRFGNHPPCPLVKVGVRCLVVICLLVVVADGCGGSTSAQHFGSLTVTVTAGPTCPAERIGDPACAPRPVKGAHLRLEGSSEVTLVTDARGMAQDEEILVGAYRLVPHPVEGLMGTPAPLHLVIRQGVAHHVALSYDTGIR